MVEYLAVCTGLMGLVILLVVAEAIYSYWTEPDKLMRLYREWEEQEKLIHPPKEEE